jgi:hypothetical protein
VDQRKLTPELDADAPHADAPRGSEQVNGAPASDGAETGLAEHHPDPAPAASNGSLPEPPPLSNRAAQVDANSEPPAPPAPAADPRGQLEDRIRRLEEALAQLNAMKERQAANAAAPVSVPVAAPVATIVLPQQQPAAPFTTAPSESATSFLFGVGKHLLSRAPVAPVAQPTPPGRESPISAGMRWSSFFFDVYAEVRAILRMFVDPRYQMSWTSRLVPVGLALLLLTSGYWAPGAMLPGIGTLIDKVIDVPLAFLLFKVLSHEARRYRQTSPDLPAALRLPP